MSIFGGSSFGFPRTKPLSSKRAHVVSVLDIGSTKVVCIIARLTPRRESAVLPGRTHNVEVIGLGHQRSHGIKSGVIADLDAVENVVRLAVDAAERMAGLTVESLIVNVSAGRIGSDVYTASIDLGGQEVESGDLRKVLIAAGQQSQGNDRAVLHSLPTGFSLDGERGIRDPLGMYGDVLGVDMHVVTAERAALRNLELCINRAHLTVEGVVATPYASGLAALVDDEVELGCAAIDMGGGMTTISVFAEGKLIHTDAIGIGGHHVTTDLARGLSTRIEDAERLKVVHGSAVANGADDREVVSVPPIGEDDRDQPTQVSKALVTRIISARIEETLEMLRDRIQKSGFSPVVGKRVVLTGGACQLTGMPEAARRILARNVRIGRPMGVSGLPAAAKGPAFSTAVGLTIYPQMADQETHAGQGGLFSPFGNGNSRFARMGQWLKESF
ncbi:MAG: cell division protein FtsA [Pseudorhizobium sp.]|jgi:cell division protein FtsA|uniref:cell division protein FtsA n=1 Tax=Rhizobium/Agrobacterium group TaxID=227290 RepID=UPI0006B9A990|nr:MULTISPECIES: cell division protein FtsA [Rhizobium/Agrobacterium group]MBU0737266.1 cell division protein FtsA [Alphaproteobacteria bacterium]MDM7980025.1 cell division protein FtsA [Rhizobium sp.]AOG08827.1 cell division protein FtsA [Agrobacterium sp. RAC06]KPF51700.1 cell division protein FtsA [Rhizobium sp. AAP116]MBU0833280.1 cell division protein FtsA [Alphaproteobacteria bacterium]